MDERTLFLAAMDKPDPVERAVFLAGACSDPVLRARVELLLTAYAHAGSFLGRPAVALTDDEPAGLDPEAPGTVIGRYKLLQQIGEGGMGTVFMAEQTEPVRRLVAVKVVKPGMDSRQVIARFEAERQAVALMDHPNIAKVFDAGTTPTGRPYFVMELVKGVPITTYCDQNRLTPRERLELFVPVCQAVQHAHQKGVIHRDLKPGNVLVALYDGRPVPKVIDFGVAKALHQRLTERTLYTGFGAVVGTLEYMAPEQAEFNQLDVDARADVYALGVLLYELLTGSTPLSRKRLKEAALDEVLRIIREEEPQKPSTRVSASAELASLAACRRTDPRRLGRQVGGDLDWIVMKALEKDRARRYGTPTALAEDLQRHLADEPVSARPPTLRYKLRRYVRRRRGWAVAILLGLGMLMSLEILVFIETIRAQHAMREAEAARVEAMMQRDLAHAERLRAEANFQKARETVDQMLNTLSERVGGLVLTPDLRRQLQLASLEYERVQLQDGPDGDRAAALARAGAVKRLLGERAEARSDLERAVRELERHLAVTPGAQSLRSALGTAHTHLAGLAEDERHYADGLAAADRAVAVLDAVSPKDALAVRNAVWTRARLLDRLQRFEEAARDWDRAEAQTPERGRAEVRADRDVSAARAGRAVPAAALADELTRAADASPSVLHAAARALALVAQDNADYAARSVALLRRAAAGGYFKDEGRVEQQRRDEDFAALRDRPDYRDWLAALGQPSKP